MLAGEYALRVLEGEELAEARRRLLSDPEFVREVQWWEDRIGTWAEEVAPVQPTEAVWPAISARLEGAEDTGNNVVPIKRGPAPWSIGLALAGLGAAAAAIALSVATPTTVPVPVPTETQVASSEGQLVAQLASEDAAIRLASLIDPDGRRLTLTAAGLTPAEGQSPELWVIPDGGAPVSLGLIPEDGRFERELTGDEAGLLQAGALIAVTYESSIGAPHEAPTLPIIVAGPLDAV
nr:anti-sigma factor [Croceicoccus gelatinilyticus]